jgi:hypothetical protein
LVEDERTKGAADNADRKRSLKLDIGKRGELIERLTDAVLDGTITKEVFEERHARLLGERRDFQDQLDAIGSEPLWLKQYREFELKNPQLLRYQTLIGAEKRDLVAALCSNLALNGKEPIITLRFPYKAIAETQGFRSGGASQDDVRTRPQQILDILTSKEYEPSAGTSPKSLKSTRQPEDKSPGGLRKPG